MHDCSLYYRNLSQNEENSSTNTFSAYLVNSTLPSRLMANLRRKFSLFLKRVSRMVVKDWWSKCLIAKRVSMNQVGGASTGWRYGSPFAFHANQQRLKHFSAQKGLSCWHRWFFGFGSCWWILREGKANQRLWCIPSGVLRWRLGGVSNNMQNWYWIQWWDTSIPLQGAEATRTGESPRRHQHWWCQTWCLVWT